MYLAQRASEEENPFIIDRISPSMFMSYTACPLAFYYAYIAKIQLPQVMIHFVFGSAIHKVLEEAHAGKTNYDEIFTANFQPEMLDEASRAEYSKYYLMGLEMIKNYMFEYPMLDNMYQMSKGRTELRFRQHVTNPLTGEVSSVPLSGIVDLLTDSHHIIDYKTAGKKWDEKDAKSRVQSLLYNLWFYTEYGHIADETLYLVLLKKFKKSSKDQTLQVVRYQATAEDLAAIFDELELVVEKINAGIFPRGNCVRGLCDCYKYESHLRLILQPNYDSETDTPF